MYLAGILRAACAGCGHQAATLTSWDSDAVRPPARPQPRPAGRSGTRGYNLQNGVKTSSVQNNTHNSQLELDTGTRGDI